MNLTGDCALGNRFFRIRTLSWTFIPLVRWSLGFFEIHQYWTLWLINPPFWEEVVVDERVIRPSVLASHDNVFSRLLCRVLQGKGRVVAHKVQSKGLDQEQNSQCCDDWTQGELEEGKSIQEQSSRQENTSQTKVAVNNDLAITSRCLQTRCGGRGHERTLHEGFAVIWHVVRWGNGATLGDMSSCRAAGKGNRI